MCGKIWRFGGKCVILWPNQNQLIMAEEKLIHEVGQSRQEIGLELAKFRIRNGLTQAQLAERWGMSRYSIIRAEKGKTVSWRFTYAIASKLTQELRKEAGGL